MKKLNLYLLAGGTILLSACSTVGNSITSHLANAEMQKKQLANGNTVYIDYNLTPTQDWNCQQVGSPQSYNWALLKTEGQLHLTGPMGLLRDKALDYANQQNLNPNYINLYIPSTWGFETGNARKTNTTNLSPNAQAVATYYQCQLINPEHKLGVIKGQGKVGVFVGSAPSPAAGPHF